MKVSIALVPEAEIDTLLLDVEDGEVPEITKAALREAVVGCRELILSQHVVEFAAKEFGLTPEEFAAWFIKEAGASQ